MLLKEKNLNISLFLYKQLSLCFKVKGCDGALLIPIWVL